MATVTLKVEDKAVRRMFKELQRKVPEQAAFAITDTARAGVTWNKRLLSKITGIKQIEISRGVVGKIYHTKATVANSLRSLIVVLGRDLTLSNRFSTRWSPLWEGATAVVGGVRRTYKGKFIPLTSKTGVIFERIGKSRLPIRPLWGPNIGRIAGAPIYKAEEERVLVGILRKKVEQRLRRLARKRYT